jgi:hypothetical protein
MWDASGPRRDGPLQEVFGNWRSERVNKRSSLAVTHRDHSDRLNEFRINTSGVKVKGIRVERGERGAEGNDRMGWGRDYSPVTLK